MLSKLTLTALLAASCILSTRAQNAAGCDSASDVVIVIDDSESLRIYDTMLGSFRNVANYSAFIFDDLLPQFNASNVEVGLVAYSKTATELSALTGTYSTVQAALTGRTPEYDTQNTNVGISQARTTLAASTRVNATKYIIVIFDGTSLDTNATRDEVILAASENITVIAVAMRAGLDEASVIAGRSYRTFSVDLPAQLTGATDIAANVSSIICAVCKGYADVVYLLDGSDSTLRVSADFSQLFYAPGIGWFVNNVTTNVASGEVRTGVIIYSATAQILTNLTEDTSAVISAVNGAMPEYANTQAGRAFAKAAEVFNTADPVRAADTRRIVLYLVDGTVTNKTDLTIEAQAVRNMGVEVFAVGFGPAALTVDLLLASGNANNIFRVASDLQLDEAVIPLTQFLCQTPGSTTGAAPLTSPVIEFP